MKRLTKSLLAIAPLTSSIGLVAVAAAMPFGDGPGCGRGDYQSGPAEEFRGMGPNLDRLTARLNLTDEQRAEVEAIQRETRQQMTALKDRMKANRSAIRDLVRSEDYNENAVRVSRKSRATCGPK